MALSLNRIKYLRRELDAERIGTSELAEIESAFAELALSTLRDDPANATAGDMLDELETHAREVSDADRVAYALRHLRNWEGNYRANARRAYDRLDPSEGVRLLTWANTMQDIIRMLDGSEDAYIAQTKTTTDPKGD